MKKKERKRNLIISGEVSEYKGVPPYCDTWHLISNLSICGIISKNREDGRSTFEEPYDNPFIDFYCELDGYMINQPLLGIGEVRK